MPAAFVKLYSTILDSSIWSEDPYTRLVWITMLTMADADGFVEAAVTGIARRANVPLDSCEAALVRLQAPDPYSKRPDHEGRRIAKADSGWTILNYKEYRELRTDRQVKEAARVKAWRERTRTQRTGVLRKGSNSQSVSVDPLEGDRGGDPTFYRRPAPGAANPLVGGNRVDLERECLALVRATAALTGEDPVEVIAQASGYKGAATTKLNPATMSDDRLLHTVRDLRADLAELRKKKGIHDAAPERPRADTAR